MVDRHTKDDRYRSVIDTSAGAVAHRMHEDQLQLLLVRPTEMHESWGAPRGRVQQGENFSRAAIREVKEGTSIDVQLEEALAPIYDRRAARAWRAVFFIAKPLDDSAVPRHCSGASAEAAWQSVAELPLIHVYQQPMIEHVVRYLSFKLGGIVPASIQEKFDVVFSYAHMLDDWMEIKKLIVAQSNAKDRKMFSRRHEVTNMQQTNAFERCLGRMWEERTGRPIIWPPVHKDNT